VNKDIMEMTVNLNGAIFRQAEFVQDYQKVYLKVFERMTKLELYGFEDILEVLGQRGG
jgi:hypothetical protein